MKVEQFQNWAKEINKDWSPEYRADARDEELRVYFNNLLIVTVDKKFDIEMHEEGHEDVVGQLQYMIER